MHKKIMLFMILAFTAAEYLSSQTEDVFHFDLRPEFGIPVTSGSLAGYHTWGVGGLARMRFNLGAGFHILGDAGWQTVFNTGFDSGSHNTELVELGGGLAWRGLFAPRLGVDISGTGGIYYGRFVGDVTAANPDGLNETWNPYFRAGAGLLLRLSPALNMEVGADYQHFFQREGPLYQAVKPWISLSLDFGALAGRSEVRKVTTEFEQVFPILRSKLDSSPMGKLVLHNGEAGEIRDVRVSLFVGQYMDQARLSTNIPSVPRGGDVEVPLYALFNDRILKLNETTKVAADIRVDYNFMDTQRSVTWNDSFYIYHRNSMTWDDDRKAAAFVSALDPAVLRYSKYVAGLVRGEAKGDISRNIQQAMGLFEALRLFGVNYVIDPTTPFTEFSKNKSQLDYLQFPFQTLTYKGGDCDDLSILFCAILESVGIRTAFITIPGHIYMAFNPGITQTDQKNYFSDESGFIWIDGRAWVPLEITMIKEGFLKAWNTGFREWNENHDNPDTKMITMESAWKYYEPVGIPDEDTRLSLPDPQQVSKSYNETFSRFANREVQSKVEGGQLGGDTNKSINRLGILYARYGLYPEARRELEKLTRGSNPDLSALINMGNVFYLEKNYTKAKEFYQKALAISPDNPKALLGLSQTEYELEHFQSARELKDKLVSSAPEFSRKAGVAVSGTGSRAAAKDGDDMTSLWDEETP